MLPNTNNGGSNTPEDEEFPLSAEQLTELHNPKSIIAFNSTFNGDATNLYKYLHTDLVNGITSGLTPDSYKNTKRYQLYKDNQVPERAPKTFSQLVWEAFNDKTMLLLTGAAVVSFILGMVELISQPPQYDPEGNKISQVDWIEGVAIMMAVVVVVFVSAANDYQKELQFAKLNKKKENRKIIVIRDKHEMLISIHHILVGDIISLATGDVVPADSILVEGSCEVDESSITGESDTIRKLELSSALKVFQELNPEGSDKNLDIGSKTADGDKIPDCMLISGSKLLAGLGKAVVTSVGTNSMYGKTMMSLKIEPESTPLQERLSQLADSISVYGCFAAILLFLVLFTRFLFYVLMPDGRFHDLDPAQKGNKFMNIFITAVTVIVVAVPEGLPLAVTLSLAFATTRMTKDGNLVRNLRACETMGSATAVCSDKTGTLTENRMSIVRGVIGDSKFNDRDINENSSETIFNDSKNYCTDSLKDIVFSNIVLNSTAFENEDYTEGSIPGKHLIIDTQPGDSDDDVYAQIVKARQEPYIGSKTEMALLNMARISMGLSYGSLQTLRSNVDDNFTIDEIVQVIPFESSRKWSGVVVKYQDSNVYRFFVKGAAEIVSGHCKYRQLSDGKRVENIDGVKKDIHQIIKSFATDALRAISLGHRDFLGLEQWPPVELADEKEPNKAIPELLLAKVLENEKHVDQGLTLDGIVGIQDPLRENVKRSVMQCQHAGVVVRMVTGDNILTARAIARNCNILTEETFSKPNCAMEGPAFRKLSKERRIEILPKLRVLARSSPEDKRLLVETLKGMGDVVAVTGDGTNDAPALKLADVGFSMGISGTEVAREASDIILMSDDFTAIVNAIKWGRCVSVSIKKFIQFQLIVNITAVILTFVSSVASEDESSVLTAVQLLWVNLIMDTLAALALATDKPDPNIMDRKPRGRSTPLITPSTWKMILGQSMLQLIITFILHFHGADIFFPDLQEITGHQQQQLNTLTFNTFVWLQFFTLIVSRKLDEADGIKSWRKRLTPANVNFFQDLGRNYYFLVILAIIGGFQTLIIFFGGAPFSIAEQTKTMWITAIGCGLFSLPVGFIIRVCPDEWAMRIFPTKLFKKFKYIAGLEFLRRPEKNGDEEALLQSEEGSSNYSTFY